MENIFKDVNDVMILTLALGVEMAFFCNLIIVLDVEMFGHIVISAKIQSVRVVKVAISCL